MLPLLNKHESNDIEVTADDVVNLFKSLVMIEISAPLVGSNTLQSVVGKYINRVWKELDPHQTYNVIKRISQMGIIWDTLPELTQTQLLHNMRDHESALSVLERSEIMFHLGRMQLNLEARSMAEKEILFDYLSNIARGANRISVTNEGNDMMALTLTGLSTMSMPFLRLPVFVRKQIVGTLQRMSDKIQPDTKMDIKIACVTNFFAL